MPSLDAFSTHGAFNMRTLTDSVNKMPYVPGRVGSLNIFDERGITTSGVMVEEKDGVLSLVQTSPRGGVAVQQGINKRTARTFETRRLCLTRNVNVDEILNLRAFGSENALADLESFVNAELSDMVPSIDMTLEHMMLGALKGTILDADGSTIYNLFTEFSVSQETEVAFNFGAATLATLTASCNSIVRKIQDNLGANTMNIRVHAFCSSTFWDDFTSNTAVNTTFERAMGVHTLADQIGGFQRESHVREAPFYWKGIYWEEYRGQLGGTTFIPADKAIFFPVNVPGLYRMYFAPGDFEGGQGMGRPRYARRLPTSQDGRSVPLEVSSYPLALCLRPKVLMIGRRGA